MFAASARIIHSRFTGVPCLCPCLLRPPAAPQAAPVVHAWPHVAARARIAVVAAAAPAGVEVPVEVAVSLAFSRPAVVHEPVDALHDVVATAPVAVCAQSAAAFVAAGLHAALVAARAVLRAHPVLVVSVALVAFVASRAAPAARLVAVFFAPARAGAPAAAHPCFPGKPGQQALLFVVCVRRLAGCEPHPSGPHSVLGYEFHFLAARL